jgi:hypothetical protein
MFPRLGLFVLVTVFFMWLGRSSALELASVTCYGVDSGMDVPAVRDSLLGQGFAVQENALPGSDQSRQLVFARGETRLSVLTYGEQVLEIFTPDVTFQGHELHLGMERRALVTQLGEPNEVERAGEVELLYYNGSSGELGVQLHQGRVDLFRLSPAPNVQALPPLSHPYDSSEDVSRSAVGVCILGLSLLAVGKTVSLARTRLAH